MKTGSAQTSLRNRICQSQYVFHLAASPLSLLSSLAAPQKVGFCNRINPSMFLPSSL